MRTVLRFVQDEHASTAVEYSVMLALILMVIIGAIATLGQGSGGMWSNNGAQLQAVGFGS